MKRLLLLGVLALAGCNDTGAVWLTAHTDAATGCQYIRAGQALTPRISSDGKTHMGCKEGAK